jgi:hypothetical protein
LSEVEPTCFVQALFPQLEVRFHCCPLLVCNKHTYSRHERRLLPIGRDETPEGKRKWLNLNEQVAQFYMNIRTEKGFSWTPMSTGSPPVLMHWEKRVPLWSFMTGASRSGERTSCFPGPAVGIFWSLRLLAGLFRTSPFLRRRHAGLARGKLLTVGKKGVEPEMENSEFRRNNARHSENSRLVRNSGFTASEKRGNIVMDLSCLEALKILNLS